MSKQYIYKQYGVIDAARHLVNVNEKQLLLPKEKRKYLCVRIVDAHVSHAAIILQALKEEGIVVLDYHCNESKIPHCPFIIGTNYSNSSYLKPKDKYIVVYEECCTKEHYDFDLEELTYHKLHNDNYLGTIILTINEEFKSFAPEVVFDKVEEYYYRTDEEPDSYIG